MPESLDVDALLGAAAQKAHENDAAGAAQLLRQALDAQAAALGADHRDLAPTLNNLALMLERQGALDEAERCYRRAHAIAATGAAPNDPLVQVSRSNLLDFLRATGRPETLEPVVVAPPEPSAPPATPAASHVEPPRSRPTPRKTASSAPPAAKPSAAAEEARPRQPAEPEPPVRKVPPAKAPAATSVAQPRHDRTDSVPSSGTNWPFVAMAAIAALALIAWFASTRANNRSAAPAPQAATPSATPPPAAAPAPTAAEPPAPGPSAPDTASGPAPARAPRTRTGVPPTRDAAPTASPPPAGVSSTAAKTSPPQADAPAAIATVPNAVPTPAGPARTDAARTDPAPANTAPRPTETRPAASAAPRPQSPGEFGRPRDGISADGDVCAGLTRAGNPWRCTPLGDRGDLDAVYYYTRVRSSRDVVVRHRWTYAGSVVRTVELPVAANTAPGFRTFSRQQTAGRRGQWEVALLGPDGAVIDTQRFTVK